MGREIYSGILTLNDALEKQINLKDEIEKSKESKKPKKKAREEIKKKTLTFQNAKRLLKRRKICSS